MDEKYVVAIVVFEDDEAIDLALAQQVADITDAGRNLTYEEARYLADQLAHGVRNF